MQEAAKKKGEEGEFCPPVSHGKKGKWD